ncbi:mannose-binding protein [Streptomyces sp. NBC_01092]|uniref:mannose-binding protein n=1 Tax=Streptomyces sp. NBC_01092 TaxID=2903748 RepID=UPI0038703F8B|nr:mannose-binding protein [Streptomyces sp. NBC_01092]
MSPQHPTTGANAEAAAARVGEAGLPPAPSEPDEAAPTQTRAPEAESGATGSASGASGTAETESGTTGAEETAATLSPSAPAAAAGTTEASEERVAVAAAVGTTPPGVRTETGVGSGRPRKPILAGAAIAGAALIAIPLLLAGSAKDDGPPDSAKGLAAEGSDTVLNPSSAPAGLDDYVAEKPSPSPKKTKKSEPPKVTAPVPAAPAPEPSPSRTAKAKPAPKPKATPQPNWSTETVFATSVLEVNQAWTTNRIRMVMQTDGNLVVYNEQGKPIWASMTFGSNHRAIFQQDGNLVIHNAEDRPIWASQTWGREGAQLVLRADAKVAIVHNGGVAWST